MNDTTEYERKPGLLLEAIEERDARIDQLRTQIKAVREWAKHVGRWTPGVAEGAGRAQAAREVLAILNESKEKEPHQTPRG